MPATMSSHKALIPPVGPPVVGITGAVVGAGAGVELTAVAAAGAALVGAV